MAEDPMSLDEFLARQSGDHELLATVEPIADQAERVKVTPFIAGETCQCASPLAVRREAIAELRPTGEAHWCCGQRLMVVAVTFTDETLGDVFAQLVQQAHRRAEERTVDAMTSGPFRPVLASNEGYDPSTAHALDTRSLMAGYRIDHTTGMPVRYQVAHVDRCGSAYGTCMLRCGEHDWRCICRCQNAYDRCRDPHAPLRDCDFR